MGPPPSARLAVVVPTLGRSPWLGDCLRALRADGGELVDIVAVDSGARASAIAGELAGRVIRVERPLGFAAATDLGIAASEAPFVAVVNDDAIVEPGWAATLLAVLATSPGVGAVQGVNLGLDGEPPRVDGAGIGWNRAWQAVQLGRDGPPPPRGEPPIEVWGVSATAAVYRRAALDAVALAGEEPVGEGGRRVFDARLGSYYEDVELAGRLRAAGWKALLVPGARARHAGSATGGGLRFGARHLLVGNRLLVLARLLGRGLWPRLPRILRRDLGELWHALARGDAGAAVGTVAGWGRAARRLPAFAHRGPPGVDLAELRRLSPSPPR